MKKKPSSIRDDSQLDFVLDWHLNCAVEMKLKFGIISQGVLMHRYGIGEHYAQEIIKKAQELCTQKQNKSH